MEWGDGETLNKKSDYQPRLEENGMASLNGNGEKRLSREMEDYNENWNGI